MTLPSGTVVSVSAANKKQVANAEILFGKNAKVLIKKIDELKDYVGIKKSIQEYGVDEKYFLDTLDDMVEQAFDDQCTGANPRLPLMSEIKDMYLRAYYGKE
jgi:alcohol dehydrogenase class IV